MLKQTLPIMLVGLALSWPVDAARSYGPVKDQDTLWSIATTLRPDSSATVQQTMLALYYKNPQAFASNNINSLMRGVSLQAPSSAEVRRYKRIDALREARKQNHYWKRGVDLPKVTPPPVPKLKERPTTKRSKPATVAKVNTAVYVPNPKKINRRIARLQAQLQVAEIKNQELNNELKALQTRQNKGKPSANVDAQVKKLKVELQELTAVLDQKDNHIKTLQASLKNASETIKSQHADNIRLFDKLKEVSPSSVPTPKVAQGKPELKLTTVETLPAAVAGATAGKVGAETSKETAKATEPSPNNSATPTETKDNSAKSVWADGQAAATIKENVAQSTESTVSKTDPTSSPTNTEAKPSNGPTVTTPEPTKTEPQTLAAAVPSATTPAAKTNTSSEKPPSATTNTEAPKAGSEADKPTAKPDSAAAKPESGKTATTTDNNAAKPETKAANDKPSSEPTNPTAKPADNLATTAAKSAEAISAKTAEATGKTDNGTGGAASKKPAEPTSDTGSAIKAPSNPPSMTSKLEPTNDVASSSSVPVSQMVNQAGVSGDKAKSSSAPLRGVSPLALAVALISLLFILALVWRAFLQQREMRRLEEEESRMADRMRKRLEDNQSSVVTTATLVEKKDPDLEPSTEIKF